MHVITSSIHTGSHAELNKPSVFSIQTITVLHE